LSASARTIKFDVPFASAVLLNNVVAAAASCAWLGSVRGVPPGPLVVVVEVVVVEVAVPPVPLARLGVAVTGMVPCARPLTEVAVATVVAVPT
jgi:hypothetical protein